MNWQTDIIYYYNNSLSAHSTADTIFALFMKRYTPFLLFSLLVFASCASSFEKIQKNKDFAYKLTKADEYFDKKQYSKANLLYEELLTVYKGTKNFENLYYKYAFTFYYNKDYLAASYHLKNFADLFPKSPKAEECEFLNSRCLYNISPDFTLDQTNTIKSINELQAFVNAHPTSSLAEEANKLIDDSREKLEEKDLYGAELYFKISEFKAAYVAFEQIIRKFPDSKRVDYYHYMMMKSYYTYARRSIPEKQQERFNQVCSEFNDFVRKYPKSPFRSEAERINALSLASLKKIASQ
jgi:outer membrane protein assembly factor BamD